MCRFFNSSFNSTGYNLTSKDAFLPILSFQNIYENLCINASDCFMPMPYLCEINCTNQEQRCIQWSEGLNKIYFLNFNLSNLFILKIKKRIQ